MSISQRLFHLLKGKNYTIQDLATAIKANDKTIYGWKRRDKNPPSELIVPIASFLDVTPYYLLTGKEHPFINNLLSRDEQQLLSYYRKASVEGKTMILLAAVREIERANK